MDLCPFSFLDLPISTSKYMTISSFGTKKYIKKERLSHDNPTFIINLKSNTMKKSHGKNRTFLRSAQMFSGKTSRKICFITTFNALMDIF